MDILATLLGSVFSGGATGLIGVIAQRYADHQNKKLDMAVEKQRGEQELAKRQLDIQITQAEYAGKLKVAETEGATAKDVAESAAFGASMFKEPERYATGELSTGQRWLMVLTDTFRGIVRPALTLYLCFLMTYVWYQVRAVLGAEDLDMATALAAWSKVVDTILYLATTCILWWFGTRNHSKQPGTKA